LTAVALGLPGLIPAAARAGGDDEVRLQFGHYEEGERRLPGVESRYDPIEVDHLRVGATLGLLDRWQVDVDFFQDTWTGASPVTTAPRPFFGNRPSAPDGVSGATPFLSGPLRLDGDLRPLATDRFGIPTGGVDDRLVHTLSSASPETRREVDLRVAHEWDDAEAGMKGGISIEPDYLSGSIGVDARLDLDAGRTVLRAAASYTRSRIDATLDHDAVPYLDTRAFADRIHDRASGSPALRDERDDWTLGAGVTRTLTRHALIESSLELRHARGYLSHPYKAVEVAFLDPDQQFLAPPGGFYADVHALLDRRPRERTQIVWSTRLLHDLPAIEAAASLRYTLRHDDWGLDVHALELEWRQAIGRDWLVTPRVRYTSQDAADFYRTLVVSNQAWLSIQTDPDGNVLGVTPWDPALLPDHYSADHRLSAYGTLSGGIAVRRRVARGLALELGFDYYRHSGSLRLGGGGEGSYSTFDSWTIDAALHLDLSRRALDRERKQGDDVKVLGAEVETGHAGHAERGHAATPAGVLFAHVLEQRGELMIGYRTMLMSRAGNLSTGSSTPNDATLVAEACGGAPCSVAAERMTHVMHMLDLMYAPTDWLTLLAMPSYVDTQMALRPLEGGLVDVHANHDRHSTGGLGDTRLGALARLYDAGWHEAHLGLVVSAPTGDTSEKFRRDHREERGFVHYGMQMGSGTWDLLPSLTVTGRHARLSFGAQVLGLLRLESEGETGYALGDELQSTVWGGVALLDWLDVSLRGVFAWQGDLTGRYDRPSALRTPMDQPTNYGGCFWDLGLGLRVIVPRGAFEGMELGVEWLQPLATDWNGYQLEREGTFHARWGLRF